MKKSIKVTELKKNSAVLSQNWRGLIDPSQKDIWRYTNFFGEIKKESRISRQIGVTSVEKFENFWLKRDDGSITGSHKFRSLEYQLSWLLGSGIKKAVLSSSGNAAISASKLLPKNKDLKLFVFLSHKTAPEKLAAVELSPNLIPILSSKPLRLAKYAIKHFKLRDLRPSRDEAARIGFRSLGFEIFEQKPRIENIFSFATSFASIRGIAEAYQALKGLGAIKKIPKLFAVTSHGKLAGNLSGQQVAKSGEVPPSGTKTEQKNVHPAKKLAVDKRVDKSFCLVDISDDEILSTRQKYPQLKTSNEGIASLAAAGKIKPVGETLVVLTGKMWGGAINLI